MIMEYLTGLTFGHITLACLTLTIVALVLAGAEKLGVVLVKIMLNADHPDAPKFDWNLRVRVMWKSIPFWGTKSRAFQKLESHSWYVKATWMDYINTSADKVWSYETNIAKHCQHKTKQDAEASYTRYTSKPAQYQGINFTLCFYILLVDLSIYLLQLAFIPTLTLLGVVALVLGTRKIAGMVYVNSKGIKGHEERITKLEE